MAFSMAEEHLYYTETPGQASTSSHQRHQRHQRHRHHRHHHRYQGGGSDDDYSRRPGDNAVLARMFPPQAVSTLPPLGIRSHPSAFDVGVLDAIGE
jgi:hypothetical protein